MAKEYKLDLFKDVLPAINRKDREYFDSLSDDEKKAITFFTLNRWMSSVESSSADIAEYYLRNTNLCVNKHFFDIPLTLEKDHRKLMWLLLTAVSPGVGNQKHKWIKLQKDANPMKAQLKELFPNMKDDDAAALSQLISKKELKEFIDGHGQQKSSKRKSSL
jgi:hypothetical protein